MVWLFSTETHPDRTKKKNSSRFNQIHLRIFGFESQKTKWLEELLTQQDILFDQSLTQKMVHDIESDFRQILYSDRLAHALRISFHDCVGERALIVAQLVVLLPSVCNVCGLLSASGGFVLRGI